jgi:fatty-acyl-CoA synthase
VFGVPDQRWGEQVAAAIVLAAGASPADPETLTAFLLERIARHKVPKIWLFVGELPTNNSGKVQKFVLRDRYQASQAGAAEAAAVAPSDR